MLSSRRAFLCSAAGIAAGPLTLSKALAQTYPSRPITMIVPFAAGGALDVVGRLLAERMRIKLGQPIIVENVAGANGGLGVGRTARATPDGYTFVVGYWGTHVANGALYSLPYDLVRDFEPIALTVINPMMVIARKSLPATHLVEFIAWLKANPDKASSGTSGVGGIEHIGGAMLQSMTGTRFTFVPYRGAGPAMQDLVAGQIDFMITNPTTSLPQVRSGNIKALAIAGATRLQAVPEVPTVEEAGLPGFHVSSWQGLWAPKGTPKDVIARLNDAAVKAMAEPDVRARVVALGPELFPSDMQTPEALAAYQKAEIGKWWPIIKAANIKGE
jgi:tripartite-type tricarboxylate transporter receptor subunit TctC